MSRDNWERLVVAVVRREQIWQLCHEHSRTPSISTIASEEDTCSDNCILDEQIINDSLKALSVSRPPAPTSVSVRNPSVSKVGNSGTGSLKRMLFSAWYRRRKPKLHHSLVGIPEILMEQGRKFSLGELKDATDNFSRKNFIRHGAMHRVYKGQLADGYLVAVKRFILEGTSEVRELRFRTEVETVGMVTHPNVLRLLGYCITPKERMLVYPLMVNGSVASCLRDRSESQPPLSWPLRKRIAIGSAKGLAYLHDQRDITIIHRDVHAARILLDEDFEPIIADFELSKLMDHNDTHVVTAVLGTTGLIDPYYVTTGKCSEKTDVFAYGGFLLELITGQRLFDLGRIANDDDMFLVDWVKKILLESKGEIIVDANCGRDHLMKEDVEQLTRIALLCTQTAPWGRPKMSKIVTMLEEGGRDLVEMWEQWHKDEMLHEEANHIHHQT